MPGGRVPGEGAFREPPGGPRRLPPQAASEAGGSIGSASALARTLAAAGGHTLMTAAVHAFSQAFAVKSGVSAAVAPWSPS